MFDKTEKITLSVEGMSCMHCSGRVNDTVKAIKGVKKVDVSLEEKQAEIVYVPSKVSADQIVNAINSLGFTARMK